MIIVIGVFFLYFNGFYIYGSKVINYIKDYLLCFFGFYIFLNFCVMKCVILFCCLVGCLVYNFIIVKLLCY